MVDSPSVLSPSGTPPWFFTRLKQDKEVVLASIAADEHHAAELRTKLDALRGEYDALYNSINSKRYSLAPVGVLPPELMGEIFEQVVVGHELASLT